MPIQAHISYDIITSRICDNHASHLYGSLVIDDKNRVLWLSESGSTVLRQFFCENRPIDAKICLFQSINDTDNGPSIAILLSHDLLRIHHVTGENYDIQLLQPICKIYSSPFGIILQRKLDNKDTLNRNKMNNNKDKNLNIFTPISTNDILLETRNSLQLDFEEYNSQQLPLLYSLTHPAAVIHPIGRTVSSDMNNYNDPKTPANNKSKSFSLPFHDIANSSSTCEELFTFDDEEIVAVYEEFICSMNNNTGIISLWKLEKSPAVPINNIDAASLDISNSSLKRSPGRTMSASIQSEVGWTIGSPTMFGGTMNIDTTMNSLKNGVNNSSLLMSTSSTSSNNRRHRRSPSPTQKSMLRNIQHPDMIANLLGVTTPPSFGRESNRSNSPLISGRITPIAGELLSGKTPPRSASPFTFNDHVQSNNDIPNDQEVNPDLRLSRAALFDQIAVVFGISEKEIDTINFDISFSKCFEIMGTLLISVRYRITSKFVMLRYVEATSSLEIIIPSNIINSETLCYKVAHTNLAIGKTLGRGKGMKIPISIIQNKSSNGKSMSLMLGTHIFSTLELDSNDYGNINILASASIEGRHFYMTNIDDKQKIFNNSRLTQNLSCSLPLAVFMGSDYPNQDIAAMLIASVTNVNLVQAALGLMIEIESQLGPKYVVIGLISTAFFSLSGTDRIKETFYNVTPKSSSHYLSENINYFSEICNSLDASTILFDILHTVFEDLHIQASRKMAALRLGDVLELVASSSGSEAGTLYSTHYRKFLDLEDIELDFYSKRKGDSGVSTAFSFTGFPNDTRSSMQWIASCISELTKLSYVSQVNSDFLLPIYSIPITKEAEINSFNTLVCPSLRLCQNFFQSIVNSDPNRSWPQKIADAFVRSSGGSMLAMIYFPQSLRHIIELSLFQSDKDPIRTWPDEVLNMIGRNDLCRNISLNVSTEMRSKEFKNSIVNSGNAKDWQENTNPQTSDGLMEVELAASELRFAEDDRVHEVCRMLRSSAHIYLRVERAPETSDLEHRHKLQMRLLSLCRRSLGCAVGRGMLTMGSLEPLMAEVLPIPPFMLAGRVPPLNTTIQLETSNAPPELTLWPDFHNGVAAGLRVGPKIKTNSKTKLSSRSYSSHVGKNVTRNWIIYNRTASDSAGGEAGHAGILFALGLLGHLNVLSVTDICDYLTQGHEPTTVAILVGMSAAKLGSADTLLSKTLCLHLPALLPPRHWDIEITPVVQTAALTGLGLLHCGSAHRLMTEFLLAEMSRRPTSDRCETREAMALSVAWSLGMVLLGKGQPDKEGKLSGLNGLADLQIEDRLQQHMDGGRRPPESHLFAISSYNDHNSKSSRILETDDINTEVTAPGATIALALIYIKSNNVEIAKRLALPSTSFKLDATRPDLLIYRVIGYCLVLWDTVEPTESWIEKQIPDVITKTIFISKSENVDSNNGPHPMMPPQAALSAYLCILCGYCIGLGLVFAGTANNDAKKAIYAKLKFLQSCREMKPSVLLSVAVEKSMKPLIEMCISCTSLALSYVMAGTGDLECLRLLRELRWKVDDVNYGTHLSLAMAIGMLFLAGGNASLQRDPLSIACLFLSICPRFPLRTADNQYHLQPLRHMYVLAVEYRALKTIDVDSGTSVALDIEVEMLDGTTCSMRAPCLLPELNLVKAVHVKSNSSDNGNNSKYYPTSMQIARTDDDIPKYAFDKDQMKPKLSTKSIPPLYVKKKPTLSSAMRASQEGNKLPMSAYNSLLRGLQTVSLPFENDDMSNMNTLLSVEGDRLQETITLENFLDISFKNDAWHQKEHQLINAILQSPQLLDIAKFKK